MACDGLFCVAPLRQATFLETGDGVEDYVQLAGTGSWVLSRRGQQAKMMRLPAFPQVHKAPRRFVVSAPDGVETIVGPSCEAQGTGHVLALGTEGYSDTVWSVKGRSGDRGVGDKTFVLLEGLGWVYLDAESDTGVGSLQEIDAPTAPPSMGGEDSDSSSS